MLKTKMLNREGVSCIHGQLNLGGHFPPHPDLVHSLNLFVSCLSLDVAWQAVSPDGQQILMLEFILERKTVSDLAVSPPSPAPSLPSPSPSSSHSPISLAHFFDSIRSLMDDTASKNSD